MEFEEMQVIWNQQNQEKLFVINESTLYKYIQKKGKSVNRLLQRSELMMFLANFVVSLMLVVDGYWDNDPLYEYILPIMYFAFSLIALSRRSMRQKEEVRFEQTMVGELDKAIWQIDYLIKQGRSMVFWYALPLTIVFSTMMFFESKPLWGWAFLLLLSPAVYFGSRWEINRCYLPRKRELEALRGKITDEMALLLV